MLTWELTRLPTPNGIISIKLMIRMVHLNLVGKWGNSGSREKVHMIDISLTQQRE